MKAGEAPLILTPDQRLRVFVSSTMRELGEERASLKEALTVLSLTPVMFELGARPHPPRALYRSYLDQSHVFIGIYWESYGWVAPDEQVSGLEDEYQLSESLPRLLYVKEPAPNRDARLKELLERIQADDLASYKHFASAEELCRLVTDDLMLLLSEQFQAASHTVALQSGGDLRLIPPAGPLTAIVGRSEEIIALVEHISRGDRLIVLTGAGGVGKSRLAVEVAHLAQSNLGIDVHFVDLTPLSSAEGVLPEIAKSLGIPEEGSRGPRESLTDYLAERRLLLLLDNFEHVAAAAVDISDLLSTCKELQVLVTSRQTLRLRGEVEFQLEPLPVPPQASTPDEVRQSPTVRLFVERAQAAQPSFELTPENLLSVAEIARRLDGIPLAVELAAARVRLLSPDALLDRMEDRLDLLSSGAADLPERQRTLWRAIDWSYNLLSADEQELFVQLAVFVDGWTLGAAEGVCTTTSGAVLDTLLALLEKSLLVVVTVGSGDPRMRMLAPVHQYADQKLNATGERDALRARHAGYFGRWAQEHQLEFRGPDQETWSDRFSSDEGNLRAAVRYWQEAGDAESLGQFIWATLLHYWLTSSLLQEFTGWVGSATAMADLMAPVTRGRLGIVNGFRALDSGDISEAVRVINEALALLDGTGTESDILFGRMVQGTILNLQGDRQGVAILDEVLENADLADDPWLEAMAHWSAGGAALFAGDLERSESHNEKVVELGRSLGSWQIIGQGLGRLSYGYLAVGRAEEAIVALSESIECFRRIHYREGLGYDLFGLASALAMIGEPVAATKAMAASDAIGRLIEMQMWEIYRPIADKLREQLEATLGQQFASAWEEGASTDVYVAADEALAAALSARRS